MKTLKRYLDEYLAERPIFLSLIRAKEALVWQKFLPLTKPVLDYGCGDGFFAKIAWGKMEVGLDIEESRIKEVEDGIYKQIVCYDGRKIPIKAGRVNTVVSNCVLEHVANVEEAVIEINKVLAKGGRFLTTVMAQPWERYLVGKDVLGNGYAKWLRRKQVHKNLFAIEKWRELFTKHGFEIVEEIGYLTPGVCQRIELSHFLSLPSLVTYKLMGRWVIWSDVNKLIGHFMAKGLENNCPVEEAGAVFFSMKKVKNLF